MKLKVLSKDNKGELYNWVSERRGNRWRGGVGDVRL